MADNLRKFTTQEVLNKVYSDSSGNSIGINAATSKETLNAALDTSNSRLNVSLAGGTIGGDVTINGDLTVNGDGAGAYDEIINGQLEVRGDATDSATGMTGFLTLSTAFTDINATDQLGRINFQAPLEAGGTDAILAGASIYGIAEATFANNNNSTGIVFATATSSVPIERMRIDSSGNIGIGIASPTSKLSVSAGRGANTGLEILDSADSNNKRIDLRLDADGDGYLSLVNASETTKVQLYSNGVSYFNGGNVGIGTNSPDALMHLKSTSSDSKIIIESSHASSSGSVDIRSASDRDSSVLFREGTTVKARIRNDASADALVLTDGVGTDTMHIKGSSVGIGIDDGAVTGYGSGYTEVGIGGFGTNNRYGALNISGRQDSTAGTIGDINFSNINSSGTVQSRSIIRAYIDGHTTASGLKFYTEPNGGASSQALQLDSSNNATFAGRVAISSAFTASELLGVKGSVSADWGARIENTHSTGAGALIKSATTNAGVQLFQVRSGSENAFTIMGDKKTTFGGGVTIASGGSTDNLYLANTSYGLKITNSTGVIDFVSNGSTRMSIANGGDVTFTSNATSNGNILAQNASAPSISVLDTTNNASIQMRALDSEVRFGSTSNHPIKIGTNDSYDVIVLGTDKSATFGGAVNIASGLTTTGAVLNLQTNEPSIAANDVLGRINFQAPLEADGADGDARLVGASIHALVTASDFNDTKNTTDLVFSTAVSETASEKMRISSAGNVGIGTVSPVAQGLTVANAGDVNLTLLADSDANGANNWPMIDFRVDNTSGNPEARIYYKQDATSLILATSNTTALTLDSSQNATFAQKIGVGASPQSFPDKNVTIEGTSAGLVLRDSTGDNQATQWGTLFTSNNNVRMMYDDSGTFQVGNADDYQGTNYEANLILDANSRISLSNNNVSGATNNTVFGKLAGDDLESGGIQNSLFGENAGHALRTGDENALLGMDSGALLQNGSRNVAIGKSSANSHATFSDCVVIGQSAEVSANSASNQIVIGRSATGVADNSVSLGNASVTNLYIAKGNDTAQTITFQDSSNTGGDIQYDHSDNQMKFGVADAVRVRIFDSALLVGRSSTGSTGNGHSIRTADSAIFSRDASGETMQVCRNADNGQFIQFRANGSIVGDIKNTGGTVSLTGFSGCHESSSSDTLEVGMVVSTIDEEHSENHAKVEISNSVGDKRVYGVVSDLEGLDGSNVTIASVGISSIKVTGSCVGGDLLESNGDGTAKVQSDDIIRSKTIGKVTMGNSTEEVKMVSCVLYCG